MGQHNIKLESLILAQNERWRRGLGMQVERSLSSEGDSGKRVINAWVTYLRNRDNFAKARLIPDKTTILKDCGRRWPLFISCRSERGPRPISLLVR